MTDELLQQLLTELSEAFRGHDPQRLLAQFAERPETTYAGSEIGELATGSAALTELFTRLLGRDATYSFVFPDPTWIVAGDSIGVIADGSGTQTAPGCATETFAYRLCGTLVTAVDGWRWLLLAGSEPTQPAEA